MTASDNYYDLLGIAPAATLAEIKKAYRKLARQHHPDMNGGDPDAAARFKLITEACEVLCDPAQRRNYDHSHPPEAGTQLAAPGHDSEAVSRVLRVLEDTWQAIRAAHPQVPAVVIIIASGTDGKENRWGHHAPKRWHVGLDERTEIMISGEGLRRDPLSVLGTLLHEAAHALAAARGIQDTSRQGRYHNKKFKTCAEELGITVEHDQRIGWSLTTVPDETATAYERQLAALQIAMTLWRIDEYNPTGTTRRNTNLLAAACPCGRSIRAAASTLAEAPVICGACDGTFTPKDSS
jgi:curved DNA-binding protein CbpA